MPLVSGGGGAFSGGTLTSALSLAPSPSSAVALKVTPLAGASAAGTDELEVYDDTGSLLAWIDAAGNFLLSDASVHAVGTQVGTLRASHLVLQGDQVVHVGQAASPADANLAASQFALWLDATPAATKLMVKAKDSGGTVRTATIALA